MGEETKFLITELNKFLNTNYNLSSFESLTKDQLLQIVCDVLVHLEATPPLTDAQKSTENIIIVILEVLQNIKYTPPQNITPEEFRDGIALGNRSAIRPILLWLLSNPQQVKKRAYLAKYVEKVECPDEMQDDANIRIMRTQYESLIEEFWKVYNEASKEKKYATEAQELQQDIAKMEDDTVKICQRIDQQKEKIDNISNKEVLLGIVRAYRNEVNEEKKLQEQLEEQRNLQMEMEREIEELRTKLTQKRSRHPTNLEPMQQIMNELRTNKILQSQLPEEVKLAKTEYEMYKLVIATPEASAEAMNDLQKEIAQINSEIQVLVERKMVNNDGSDSELGPFRNQAAIIANKKQEISSAVINLKNEINTIEVQISEKEKVLTALVGGPLLQGENLKKYVAKLREHNVLYKEYKAQLRALTTEQGILTRTLDVLKSTDPTINEALLKQSQQEEYVPTDSEELKNKIKKMASEADQVRAETAQVREELRIYTNEMQPFLAEYNKLKETFEEVTGPVTEQLKEVQGEMELMKEQIKEQEEKWKRLHLENGRKQELLVRLEEDLANAADGNSTQPTQVDILEEKLLQQKNLKTKLEKELSYLDQQKAEGQENLQILENTVKLLKAKDDPVSY